MKFLTLRRTDSGVLGRNEPKIAEKAANQSISTEVLPTVQELLIPGLVSIKECRL